MEQKIKSFEDLKAYKAYREFRMFVHSKTMSLLFNKNKYDLANQTKRSNRSSTANIAEGSGRFHYMDKSKLCRVSRDSPYETLEQYITAKDKLQILDKLLLQARTLSNTALAILNGYINYLFKSAEKSK